VELQLHQQYRYGFSLHHQKEQTILFHYKSNSMLPSIIQQTKEYQSGRRAHNLKLLKWHVRMVSAYKNRESHQLQYRCRTYKKIYADSIFPNCAVKGKLIKNT
jgi:hypothetical protein